MKLRLTKTSKIVFPIAIVLLSVALGFLVWRVNIPQTVSPTDSEASEYDSQCADADYVFTMNANVCSPGWHNPDGSCPPSVTRTINVPDIPEGTTARFNVEGVVIREEHPRNQPYENLYITVNGVRGRTTVDEQSGTAMSAHLEVLSPPADSGKVFTFKPSSNKVVVYSAVTEDTPGYPNSVFLANICLYSINECGDEIVELDEECDPPGSSCTVEGKSATCSDQCTCDVNPFCGDRNLDPNETCELDDPTGSQCTWSSCNQTTCTCLAPGLNISKSVVESCNGEGTQNPVSQLTYTIKVENTGPGIGSVLKIEDVLDSKVVSAGITPSGITTPGQYSNGVILWDFSSSPLVVEAGSSQTYTYTLSVDKENFGLYDNTVTLTPTQGNALQAVASISADCEIVEPSVPQTGLFDTTLGRISVGFLLLLVGGMVYNIPNKAFIFKSKPVNYKYRDRFEQKVAKK